MIRSSSTFDLSLKILNHNSERFSSSIQSSKMTLQTDLVLYHHFPYHQQDNCAPYDVSKTNCFQEDRTPRTMHITFNKCNDVSSSLSLVSSSSTSSSVNNIEMPPSIVASSLIDGPATRALRRTMQEQQERQTLMKRYMNRTYDIDDTNNSSRSYCDIAFPITKRRRPNFGSEVTCPSNPQSASSSSSSTSQPILHNWNTVYESLVNTSAPTSTDSKCCNEPFPKIDYSIFDE